MSENKITRLVQPGEFYDPLTEVLRQGARSLLAQAVEAEVAAFLEAHADTLTEDGRKRLVCHGHLPERALSQNFLVNGVLRKKLDFYASDLGGQP